MYFVLLKVTVYVEFVVDIFTLEHVALRDLLFSLVVIFPLVPHIYSCIIYELERGPDSDRNAAETQIHPTQPGQYRAENNFSAGDQ
jgi:hypothetical protein